MAEERDLERLIETLKEPVQLDAGFDRRVMSAIEQLPAEAAPVRAQRSWLRRPSIQLSPLGALAAAASIALLVLAGSSMARNGQSAEPAQEIAGPAESARATQFVFVAPTAKSVSVVGDFNDWNVAATPLVREAGDGMWWVSLPLSPGRYRYAFVVDGTTWRSDPDAPRAEDEFGRPSSVVSIGGA